MNGDVKKFRNLYFKDYTLTLTYPQKDIDDI